MKKEYKKVLAVAKKILNKEQLKKIKNIKATSDRTEGLKYLIHSLLRIRIHDLELEVAKVHKKELLIIESKVRLLKAKIKVFISTYHARDFAIVEKLIKEINKEINNVWLR